MVELGLIKSNGKNKPAMLHNQSEKFESSFLNVDVSESNAIMFHSLAGSRLGIWVAHGEGRFIFPEKKRIIILLCAIAITNILEIQMVLISLSPAFALSTVVTWL